MLLDPCCLCSATEPGEKDFSRFALYSLNEPKPPNMHKEAPVDEFQQTARCGITVVIDPYSVCASQCTVPGPGSDLINLN